MSIRIPGDDYQLQAMRGVVRFMSEGMNLPLPWRISLTNRLIVLPPGRDTVVVAATGEIIATLSKDVAEALVALATHGETVAFDSVSYLLFQSLMHAIVKPYDPRFWQVRPVNASTDPSGVLAEGKMYAVECMGGGRAMRVILSFPTRAMAEHFCQDGRRVHALAPD